MRSLLVPRVTMGQRSVSVSATQFAMGPTSPAAGLNSKPAWNRGVNA